MKPTSKKRLSRKSRPASRQSKATVSVPRNHSIVPPFLRTTLIFGDFYNLATGGTTSAIYVFRANSCRDPYGGLGGGSPSGFPALSNLYLRYRILDVRVECWGYNTCQSPLMVGFHWRPSYGTQFANGIETQQMLLEYPFKCSYVTVMPYTGTGMPHPKFRLDGSRTPDQIEGRATNTEEDYRCTFNAEPNLQTYCDVCLCAGDGVTTSLTCNAYVKIHYRVECYEPNQNYTA